MLQSLLHLEHVALANVSKVFASAQYMGLYKPGHGFAAAILAWLRNWSIPEGPRTKSFVVKPAFLSVSRLQIGYTKSFVVSRRLLSRRTGSISSSCSPSRSLWRRLASWPGLVRTQKPPTSTSHQIIGSSTQCADRSPARVVLHSPLWSCTSVRI